MPLPPPAAAAGCCCAPLFSDLTLNSDLFRADRTWWLFWLWKYQQRRFWWVLFGFCPVWIKCFGPLTRQAHLRLLKFTLTSKRETDLSVKWSVTVNQTQGQKRTYESCLWFSGINRHITNILIMYWGWDTLRLASRSVKGLRVQRAGCSLFPAYERRHTERGSTSLLLTLATAALVSVREVKAKTLFIHLINELQVFVVAALL